VDVAVTRILEFKFRLRLFEQPYAEEGRVAEVFETKEQRTLAREIARQSIVLMKNDGLLPLEAPATIAVIGPNAHESRHLLGDYSYPSTFELVTFAPMPGSAFIDLPNKDKVRERFVHIPTIFEAIQTHLREKSRVLYAQGCAVQGKDRSGFDAAIKVAEAAEVVILVLGDKSGLVPDCTTGETRDRADLGLPGVQQELVQVIAATGTPIVAVLVTGRPYAIPWMHEHIPAILEAWLPGEEGGGAVADILFGVSSRWANPRQLQPQTLRWCLKLVHRLRGNARSAPLSLRPRA
jgi:beta-glucosidase